MQLVQLILWNAPFVVLALLGFLALAPAQAGRRRLAAWGLGLILIYGVGYLSTTLLTYFEVFWRFPPLPVVLGERVLDVALSAGFLLLLLGLTRRVRTAPAPRPDPAWSAPPPAAAGAVVPPGHGSPGAYAPRPGPQPPAAARRTDTYPSGPQHPGAGPPPAPAPPPTGGEPNGQPPPSWQDGRNGPWQPPDAETRPDG